MGAGRTYTTAADERERAPRLPKSPRLRKSGAFLLLVVLSITFLLHLLVIAEPFGRDQGIFAYIGQTVLRGGVPYRDAWDHKTPGLYGVYALAFALFGQTMPSVHLFEGIVLTATAVFVYLAGRKLHSQGVGLLSALIYGVSATLLFEWWDRGQAEIYMGFTGTLAVYFLLRACAIRPSPQPSPRWGEGADSLLLPSGESSQGEAPQVAEVGVRGELQLLLSGLFCGLTLYFKPTGLPLLVGLGLAVILLFWGRGLRQMTRLIVALCGGVVVSFVPLIAYFAAHGALDDLIQTVIVFNAYHARIGGNPTLAGIVTGTLDFAASMNILAPLAVVGLWALLTVGAGSKLTVGAGFKPALSASSDPSAGLKLTVGAGRKPPLSAGDDPRAGFEPAPTLVLPIWLLASAAGIWTQGKFFSYHWSPVLPPLAILAAWGCTAIAQDLRQRHPRVERGLLALVCLAVIAVYAAALGRDHVPKWTRDARFLLGQTSSEAYLASFGHDIQGRDKYSFSETQETARYLQAHTSPDDYVLVWGFQALVNFLADRRAPTRYIFTYPLTFDRPESALRVQARRTFLSDLEARPPRYIVLVTNDVNPLQAVDSYALLAGFPEFQRILQQHYRLETDIGEFHIYRRIDA